MTAMSMADLQLRVFRYSQSCRVGTMCHESSDDQRLVIIAVLRPTTVLTTHINDIGHATSKQKKVAGEASKRYGLLTKLRFRVEKRMVHFDGTAGTMSL